MSTSEDTGADRRPTLDELVDRARSLEAAAADPFFAPSDQPSSTPAVQSGANGDAPPEEPVVPGDMRLASLPLLQVVARHRALVALMGLVGLLAGFLYVARTPAVYEAEARLVVAADAELEDPFAVLDSFHVLGSPAVVATFAEVLDSGRIHRQAAGVVGLGPEELAAYRITPVVLPESNVVAVGSAGPDAATAADLANAVATEGAGYFETLYRVYNIDVLDTAQVPAFESGLSAFNGGFIGAVLGLVAGTVAAVAVSGSRRSSQSKAALDSRVS